MTRMPPLKHVIDVTNTSVTSTTLQRISIATGTINPNYVATPDQVRNGSLVTMLNIQFEVVPDATSFAAAPVELDWYVAFDIATGQTMPNPNAVGVDPLAPQVFHQDMALLPISSAATTAGNNLKAGGAVWRTTVAVPRSYQRVNDNDKIALWYQFSSAQKYWVKAKIIYKEIFP